MAHTQRFFGHRRSAAQQGGDIQAHDQVVDYRSLSRRPPSNFARSAALFLRDSSMSGDELCESTRHSEPCAAPPVGRAAAVGCRPLSINQIEKPGLKKNAK
jgi:hypothetical protein